MAVLLDDSWRLRLDIRMVVRDLGLEIKADGGHYIAIRCPIPGHTDQHPSFSIITEQRKDSLPGHWSCHACGKHGNIEQLVEIVSGKELREARYDLIKKWAPDHEPVKTRGPKKRDDYPEAKLDACSALLLDTPPIVEYLTNVRGLSLETVKAAKLGTEGSGEIILPVFGKQANALISMRRHHWLQRDFDAGKPKMQTCAGWPVKPYPLWMSDLSSRRRVVCEGEWDTLLLHSIGETDAITTTGGVGTLTVEKLVDLIPVGDGSEVVVAIDNDPEGRKCVARFVAELLTSGVETVRVVTEVLPRRDRKNPKGPKDVSDALVPIEASQRAAAWADLLAKAPKRDGKAMPVEGLIEADGCIASVETGEEVAAFTGRVVSSGRVRRGAATTGRAMRLDLIHKSGRRLSVVHSYGEPFAQTIVDAGGPEWMLLDRNSDRVLNFFARNSGEVPQQDQGWLFGFDKSLGDGELGRFYTRDVIFSPEGAYPNEEVEMQAPSPKLDAFRLPLPDSNAGRLAARSVLTHVYGSQQVTLTAPLIACGFLAPVQRLLWRNSDRFPVIVHGKSGSGKTSRSLLVQSLYGRFDNNNDIHTWSDSTINAIDITLSYAGDSFFMLDEFRLLGKKQNERSAMVALLQSMSQGGAKIRATRDGKIVANPDPHCLVCVTAEALAVEDQGQLARALIVESKHVVPMPPEFDSNYLEAVKAKSTYPHALSSWINWVMSSPDAANVFLEAKERADTLTDDAFMLAAPSWRSESNGFRVIERSKIVTATWLALLAWARITGALEPNVVEAMELDWERSVLPSLAGNFQSMFEDSGAEVGFLDEIASGIMSRSFILTNPNENMPCLPADSNPYSKAIGYYRRVTDSTVGVSYLGNLIQVGLTPACATISGSDPEAKRWRMMVQYLRNADLLERESGRISTGRVAWMTKEGTTKLLRDLPGFRG